MKNFKHDKGQIYHDGWIFWEWLSYEQDGKYYAKAHMTGDGYDAFEDVPLMCFATERERDAYLDDALQI